MADNARASEVLDVSPPCVADCGNDSPQDQATDEVVVSRHVVGDQPKERRQRAGASAHPGLAQLRDGLDAAPQDATSDGSSWTRTSGWNRGSGRKLLGRPQEGPRGRGALNKAIVVIAAEQDGNGIGRIRLRWIPDVSATYLLAFVQESVSPGATVVTDGWPGYQGLAKRGYRHNAINIHRSERLAHQLLPRVHRVASLLKRWLLGTHQGAVQFQHLDYYLDEFTFRFNRRNSRHRGKLFYRVMQQVVAVGPTPYDRIVGGIAGPATKGI